LTNSDKSTKRRTVRRRTTSQTAINNAPRKAATKQQPTHSPNAQQQRDLLTKGVYVATSVEETTVEMLAGYSLAAIAVWEMMSRLFFGKAASLAIKAEKLLDRADHGPKKDSSLTTPSTASSPESMAA
jgi:hypothetical protein